jgi:hypothetical protein
VVLASTITTAIGIVLGCLAARAVDSFVESIQEVGHGDNIRR